MSCQHATGNQTGSIMYISLSPVVKAFLAGSFSGTCSTLLFQPLDLVKTRIQQVDTQRSMRTVIQEVIVKDTVTGLWRGLSPSLVRTVPGVGIYFSSMHTIKMSLFKGAPTPSQSLLLGAFSRSLAGVLMMPLTVVKIRSESEKFAYRNLYSSLRCIQRTEGLRGLASGLLPTLGRDVPFSGIYLMFYEQLKALSCGRTDQPDLEKVACGLVAGVLASTVTQPADVIKTKLQLNLGSSVLGVVKHIALKHGLVGFFRGGAPRALRRTLMAALAWSVYEQVMKNMGIK